MGFTPPHPDRVLAAVEEYWSPRLVLARLMSRWDGWATSRELFEAYVDMVDEPASDDALYQAMRRLALAGCLEQRRVETRLVAGSPQAFVDAGTRYEYRFVRMPAVRAIPSYADVARPCVNENRRGTHGIATHGVRCLACFRTHMAHALRVRSAA